MAPARGCWRRAPGEVRPSVPRRVLHTQEVQSLQLKDVCRLHKESLKLAELIDVHAFCRWGPIVFIVKPTPQITLHKRG